MNGYKKPIEEEEVMPIQHIDTAGHVSKILEDYDVFIIDCDGVLWHSNELIDGTLEMLQLLRKKGKKLAFLTNNSTRSRKQYLDKFNSMMHGRVDNNGKPIFEAQENEIFCSSYLAARYIRKHLAKEIRHAYVVGEIGIEEELKNIGVTTWNHDQMLDKLHLSQFGPETKYTLTEKQISQIPTSQLRDIDCVIAGWDRHFTFAKICVAALCLKLNPSSLFIATNRDNFDAVMPDKIIPGGGAMVASIEASVEKKPIVIGKPETWFIDDIAMELNIQDKKRMIMIGDRLNTDILLAKNASIDSILVYTGVTTKEEVECKENSIVPTYSALSFGTLAHLFYNSRPILQSK